ncbi:glycosyltransferase family 2 protein ['Paenibacillus yunnanensis' Narsing Rao et al. 2020]|uniref:glycosyltransferase family 2 protein n=1 Tax=Paenibacillus tengchongensis TaxID=2608684 RepID=UPI00124DA8D9|nr:glycosyltransferase family A protein [Paenibacillus tengchongensis]
MTAPLLYYGHDGISVITCTKRARQMDALLRNYGRQNYRNKELIIILNHPSLRVYDYMRAAQAYPNVRVYSLPAHVPLGACLNAGVGFARCGVIAKFDDDDYYAPGYLTDSRRLMQESRAAIVGKRAHFMYLAGRKQLLLRYKARSGRYVDQVQGATLLAKREVLEQVRFPELDRGECVKFCTRAQAKGYRIYAGSPWHFLAIRSGKAGEHTWKISDHALLARNAEVLKVRDVLKYIEG